MKPIGEDIITKAADYLLHLETKPINSIEKHRTEKSTVLFLFRLISSSSDQSYTGNKKQYA